MPSDYAQRLDGADRCHRMARVLDFLEKKFGRRFLSLLKCAMMHS